MTAASLFWTTTKRDCAIDLEYSFTELDGSNVDAETFTADGNILKIETVDPNNIGKKLLNATATLPGYQWA